ncbi:hypothetical protein NLJ89_g1906 [Agrocybe chaxingu]|uniref:Uncharacterized protein n=1 Tax=Agrocybe chaxingu TaxID=84603 RepID=A0A9W8MZ52_9AGAR|nr:hypothetical protein NLJ89_g1906 [Agrocybe chaxingu]
MSAILYGADLVMYFMTMHTLFYDHDGDDNTPRSRRFFVIYSTALFLLLTINISVNSIWGERMWITFRDGPGGVPAYIMAEVSVWYQTMGSTSVVAMVLLGDALMLYRLFIIYGSRYWAIALPILIYFAAFSLAILELVLAANPGRDFFQGKNINFGTPYFSLVIALNLVITILICTRLTKLSKMVSRNLGSDSARTYTSIVSMLIESAAPYSLVGILFLIFYAAGSTTAISSAFGQVWAKLACISPQLITLRVVTGRAWGKEIITQAQSSLDFGTCSTSGAVVVNPGDGHIFTHASSIPEEASGKRNSSTRSLV